MSTPRAHILTFGCQMNKHDSELMAGVLTAHGYRITDTPDDADVILVNTCSVREGAEQRVIARFGDLKRHRKRDPDVVLGICGCMAQRYGRKILDLNIGINLVVGPDGYNELPALIDTARSGEAVCLELTGTETYDGVAPVRTGGRNAWISIMRGCNNFCSYCIVPYLRGRERSMPAGAVVAQVRALPPEVKELTLLGQNVNSYDDHGTQFADLLRLVDPAADGRWIRFTSSHPKDFGDDVVAAMADLPNVCEFAHLAMQSGSDSVLKAMNRRYTAADYLRIIERIRTAMPDAAVFTDIIVGFPGETDADFEATLDAVRTARFDNAFMFKYSPRPGTAAAKLQDSVPEHVKTERITELVALQHRLSHETGKEKIGGELEVLVEGPSRKRAHEWSGRSRANRSVIFPAEGRTPGEVIRVKVTDADHLTLFGQVV